MSKEEIRAYFCSVDLLGIKKNLNDLKTIYDFLDKLLMQNGFKQIHKPVLVPYYFPFTMQ